MLTFKKPLCVKKQPNQRNTFHHVWEYFAFFEHEWWKIYTTKYICYILLPNEEKNEVSNAITVDDWAIFLHMM